MRTDARASQGRGRSCPYMPAGGPAGMNRPAGNGCPGFRPGLPAAPSRGIKEPRRGAAHRRRKPLEPRMTEIVLHDIDQDLVDRIKRVAATRGWTLPRPLPHLLEQGLQLHDGAGSVQYRNSVNEVIAATTSRH